MALQRNIDTRGRIARGATGVACLAIAAAIAGGASQPRSAALHWTCIIALMAAGLFQVFEAAVGWCVARACGLRTPL
jgi:hypothetical protein